MIKNLFKVEVRELPEKKNKPESVTDILYSMRGEVTYLNTVPEKKAETAPVPVVAKELRKILEKRGITELYSHQSEAIKSIMQGHDTIIATPTASGKTMCYNIPVINSILKGTEAKALYLFPTKALANDQLRELTAFTEGMEKEIYISTYDGDTPKSKRQEIRYKGDIVITNPDMLNISIMPYHTGWSKFLSELRYIVIDELHMYRGTFGSHTANIIERLRRICARYGSSPVFVCSSATIANPAEHALHLTGRKMKLITESGAPSPEKDFAIYVPPYINKKAGIRVSSLTETAEIATKATVAGRSSIVFTTSKSNTELLVKRIREKLSYYSFAPEAVQSYRSGYLPAERRKIEQDLRNGKIKCIVSTNALEAGIDIGSLDTAIIHGYPGSIASTHQQAGRAGRRGAKATAVLVASATPLNTFLAYNPDYITSSPNETARINALNPYVMVKHILCAAKETGFTEGEKYLGHNIEKALEFYTKKQLLRKEIINGKTRYLWNGTTFPQAELSLRSTATGQYTILERDVTNKIKKIGMADFFTAQTSLYPGAIYIHMGKSYLVISCDPAKKECTVIRSDGSYYTETETTTNVRLIKKEEERENCGWGITGVKTEPLIYYKKDVKTGKRTEKGEIKAKIEEKRTTSAWLLLPLSLRKKRDIGERVGLSIINLLRNTLPLYLMCGADDIEITCNPFQITKDRFTIWISDTAPGGVGLAEGTYNSMHDVLTACCNLIEKCPCSDGCPSCIGTENEDFEGNLKEEVLAALRELLAE